MTGFSDQQLDSLKAPLSGDKVKTRRQAGRDLSYIEGWLVISEANRIFGFDAWDRETIECRCVSEKAAKLGPNKDRDGWRVAYVGKVRIKVRAGDQVIIREGTGYGSGIDADVGEAHESAAKECETDATKRAMMTFGSPMGLALYDKAQAEVEPAATPRSQPTALPPPRRPRAGEPDPFADDDRARAPAPPTNDTVDPERKTKHDRAVAARDRIKAAIEKAQEPVIIEEILRVNRVDLEFILAFHEPTYTRLMGLATARSNELRSAA